MDSGGRRGGKIHLEKYSIKKIYETKKVILNVFILFALHFLRNMKTAYIHRLKDISNFQARKKNHQLLLDGKKSCTTEVLQIEIINLDHFSI